MPVTDSGVCRSAKTAAPEPEQDAKRITGEVRNHQIRILIIIQVGDYHGTRLISDPVLRRCADSSCSVPQEHRYIVVATVCHDQIGPVVPIDVSDSHSAWLQPDADGYRR